MGDCGGAGVERKNRATAFGRCEGKVAHAAAKVEHAAVQVGNGGHLKRIELEVTIARLLLKLRVKELDAAIGVHK